MTILKVTFDGVLVLRNKSPKSLSPPFCLFLLLLLLLLLLSDSQGKYLLKLAF